MDIIKVIQQEMDDAAELAEREKRQPNQANLASQISAYLNFELPGNEVAALYQTHGKDIERERVRRDLEVEQKRERDARKAKSLWFDDLATKADCAAADAEIRKFILAHPGFKRTIPENANLLLRWLAENNLLCTLENLERAYAALRQQTGVFIEATPDEEAIARMSADQYRASRPELQDTRTSPIALAAAEKALLTFASFHPEYVASARNGAAMLQWLEESQSPVSITSLEAAFGACRRAGVLQLNSAAVSSGSTTFVDYGPRQPGYPPQPQKYSFRQKIANMSADEIAARCNADPAFKEAFDNL